ncbi:MAG: SpoIIE family protein phosphatase [Bacteroidota bacterium]
MIESISIEQRMQYLRTIKLFSEVDDKTLAKIAGLFKTVEFDPDEIIFRKGDQSTSLFIIREGRVRIHDEDHLFKILSTNDFFGEYALMDSEYRSTSVTSISHTILLELRKDDLFNLIDTRAQITKGIVRVLTQRLRKNNELVAELVESNNQIKRHKDQLALEKARVKEQKNQIESQKDEIERQKKEITDSINYAKLIQNAILPDENCLGAYFKENFILFMPKDIVSGDFYWVKEKMGKIIITAVDCTGHGIPGAFMSMLGITLLNEITGRMDDITANAILNALRDKIISTLKQTGEEGSSQDGMDMAICIIDRTKNSLQYSGANNPVYIIRKKELIELKADRMPVGYYEKNEPFKNEDFQLEQNDSIYLFSDGFSDQLGYNEDYQIKKLKSGAFKQLLLNVQDKSMEVQRYILEKELSEWRSTQEQTDDIIVIGIRNV